MKARSIVLTIAVATLTFILGGFVVYQVVAPKENKEEEKAPVNGECEVCENCKECSNREINLISKGGKTYINGKVVINPCGYIETPGEEYYFEPYTNNIRIFNNYITFDYWCGGTGDGKAIFNNDAERIYEVYGIGIGIYLEETKDGYLTGNTTKDSNGTHYWEETIIDLSGSKADIKTTKEKINVDCKIYGGDAYYKLSEKDKMKYYECCNDCL